MILLLKYIKKKISMTFMEEFQTIVIAFYTRTILKIHILKKNNEGAGEEQPDESKIENERYGEYIYMIQSNKDKQSIHKIITNSSIEAENV